ncbi:aminopeptidase [Sutcliffiella sp. NC1]|uniref:aminopeptidase n=1 Tax=Sutcliffiella sp. NC1 TaxID=3004096 RepID=UPI0022DCE83B|nr:aminopeptidase [Sutcliffiella sp. NC1]WBL13764.1 aminopeptidase [Sutcliffiella sp. NC1]
MMNVESLKKYAELALKIGINLQQGQPLVVQAPITAATLVREVTKLAYEFGAKYVHIDWHDSQITKIAYEGASLDSLKEVRMWKVKGMEEMAEEGAAFLRIVVSDPDLLKEVAPEKVSTANIAEATALKKYRSYIQTGKVSWSIISVPSEAWASKLYPDLPKEEALNTLWDHIFAVTRLNELDPVAAWESHLQTLQEKLNYLNNKKYEALHYEGPGTELKIELPTEQVWLGGGIHNERGTYFVPNLPTEEVFTAPVKTGVDGTVTSTKPLNLNGKLVNNFTLTFKEGRVIDYSAEVGQDVLQKLLETDEGAMYLGEVALVPNSSPISKLNVIFYNTLFDENASSHLALGSAYPICINGGGAMTKNQLEENGINTSVVHVDFMIGSSELTIYGIAQDGKKELLMEKGEWAI